MNVIDVAILILVAWGSFIGFKKGLIIEVASILSLVIGIYGAYKFSPYLTPLVLYMFEISEKAAALVGFGILFIVIVVLVHFVAKGVEKLAKTIALGTLNRLTGACFGGLKFLMICGLALFFVERIDAKTKVLKNDFKEGSLLYEPVVNMQQKIFTELLEEDSLKKGP